MATSSSSADYFDRRAADDWDSDPQIVEMNKMHFSLITRLLDWTDERIAGAKVLDFGSGTGLMAYHFAAVAKEVVALDASAGMIAALRQKIASRALKNVRALDPFMLNDASVGGMEHDFDLVVSAMTMHHVDNLDEVLRCLSQLVKPGGRLAVIDLASGENTHHFHDHVDLEKAGVHHNHGFDQATAEKWMTTNGLRVCAYDAHTPIVNDKVKKIAADERKADHDDDGGGGGGDEAHGHSHSHAHGHGHGHDHHDHGDGYDFRVFCVVGEKV